MNHPETQSNDNTDSKSAVYGRRVHQKSSKSLPLQQWVFHTNLNVVRDHNVAFIITPLF